MNELADSRRHADRRPLPRIGGPGPFLREQLPMPQPLSPATMLEFENVWWGLGDPHPRGALERWLTTVWPANREACYRLAARRLWIGTDDLEPDGIVPILSLMLDADEPLGLQARLALGLALGAGEPGLRELGREIATRAITARRLDGPTLGQALAHLLNEHREVAPARPLPAGATIHAIPDRWSTELRSVATTSDLAAHDIQAALETLLAGAAERDPARIGGHMRLLRHLALDADARITRPGARAFLERYSPRTAGGRIARELLAISGTGAERTRAAAKLANKSPR
jgi:hypothetical protein